MTSCVFLADSRHSLLKDGQQQDEMGWLEADSPIQQYSSSISRILAMAWNVPQVQTPMAGVVATITPITMMITMRTPLETLFASGTSMPCSSLQDFLKQIWCTLNLKIDSRWCHTVFSLITTIHSLCFRFEEV